MHDRPWYASSFLRSTIRLFFHKPCPTSTHVSAFLLHERWDAKDDTRNTSKKLWEVDYGSWPSGTPLPHFYLPPQRAMRCRKDSNSWRGSNTLLPPHLPPLLKLLKVTNTGLNKMILFWSSIVPVCVWNFESGWNLRHCIELYLHLNFDVSFIFNISS